MSRTRHVRAPQHRAPDDTTSNKKPDERRRWMRRFLRVHDIVPIRDQRRLQPDGDE